MKKILFSISLLTSLSLLGAASQSVGALSGSQFQAGRIMDDGVFFNGNSANSTDIQAFLNSKVPVCDTNGTQPYGGTTRAAYGASRGYPAPYTCLRNYSQDTPTKTAETGLCNHYSGGTKSAAQIIQDVGQSCGVNPKVLIVLLEKEQSLITDDWPWSIQYRSATGYGCPDTAPCDAEYYGFFNQVYNAARQFKRYGKDETLFRYRAYRDNYIQYNPNAGCGGTNVYIQNQATAGLYNYTPYQPNPSALANIYGTGDSCGAYGNRNFWRIYNDWFGSTFNNPLPPLSRDAGSPIALSRNQDGRLQLVGIAGNDSAYYKAQTAANSTTWSGWTQLDGALRNISAETNADGRIQLVGIAFNGNIYQRAQTSINSNSWSGWTQLDGALTNISIARNNDGTLEAFGSANDGSIYHRRQTAVNSTVWSSWVQMDGALKYISAETNADGRIQLVGIASNGSVYNKAQTAANSTTWSGWTQLDGALRKSTVARNQDGRLEIFGIAGNDSVYRKVQITPGGAWSGWTQLDGALRNISAETNADGRIQLVGIASNGSVYNKAQTAANSTTWSGWTQLDGALRPF